MATSNIRVHFVSKYNSSYILNDIHWLPAEHMLHIGLTKRSPSGVSVLSRHDIKREIDEGTGDAFTLMDNANMVDNNIVPDFMFMDTRDKAELVLCVFLLPDERWGVEHTDITAKLRLLDKNDVNFLLIKQRANYSDGRMDAIIRDLEMLLEGPVDNGTTEREGG